MAKFLEDAVNFLTVCKDIEEFFSWLNFKVGSKIEAHPLQGTF